MIKIQGIAAAAGIVIAKAFIMKQTLLIVEKRIVEDATHEIARFQEALQTARAEVQSIKERTFRQLGTEKAEIFESHLLILNDPELIDPVEEHIRNEQVNAEFALQEVATAFVAMFENSKSPYLRERAADMQDVTKRVLGHLLKVKVTDLAGINEKVILVAEDLTPSDTAQLNQEYVMGFTTNIGGRTSHSAIMARSLEIPAVVGTKNILTQVNDGDTLILDGLEGFVIIDPDSETLNDYRTKQEEYEKKRAEWAKLQKEPTITRDGTHVELAANIGAPADTESVLANGGEAVGLYRTEFLYMGRNKMPSEEEQFNAYRAVLEKMEGKPVVVRTLDIGGDKELPYLELPKEMNPFLGHRAIRLCLDRQDIFRTQVRALLRASIYGNLRIMFPMIATLDEFRQAKIMLLEEKKKLGAEGIPVSDCIQLGIMVEIPSTAVLADQFAKEVDFFSIGTNDLIQYTLAADRMNERVSYLYQPFNPSILRLVKMVIDAAHKEGRWVGMCGEMAGDSTAIPILIGMGLDEFSMSAASILPAHSLIAKLTVADTQKLATEALDMRTALEVQELVASYIGSLAAEAALTRLMDKHVQ
ncbi:phosphoenolpyruvate-protein phosphotransferase PtsI [Paenibacillus larvae subsp. larvae]|uniref:Phosphoenolpyruvate-protein phosphotransferase n=1 Tax=Paenibacillus larvae subsp. larvae TaxID=147375 RepID=A0A2L1TZP2_9BACL|nr:phosphoenolpyruvate--protein phosphotransferase [Paenibacillus larvae]AQZ48185.1 phosphoenolpyruvate--protein phosphotransferase [Paenibacillus larvae subsp. pulvifaciens]AVF26146.1 phosphoenolpyruvate-protein phosphotransferase PtsI [Paenibacillus larvae subsp. larvae]AVF30924.1 phosphoenolpyruvate-protein phosphotransferase PtsI [Paenibacillus larvae subsp. larvae]MCY7518335.1 phosphoenolpyruvate--protein phosphotransferase [Paenibacillus larvae]MCY9500944.1 phosphoenolpyruvate--protein p